MGENVLWTVFELILDMQTIEWNKKMENQMPTGMFF